MKHVLSTTLTVFTYIGLMGLFILLVTIPVFYFTKPVQDIQDWLLFVTCLCLISASFVLLLTAIKSYFFKGKNKLDNVEITEENVLHGVKSIETDPDITPDEKEAVKDWAKEKIKELRQNQKFD